MGSEEDSSIAELASVPLLESLDANKQAGVKRNRKSVRDRESLKKETQTGGNKWEKKKPRMARKASKEQEKKGPMEKRKSRKRNKDKKEKNNRKDRKTQTRSSSNDNAICFKQSITIMKMWKDVISNFDKQKMRMKRQNSTGGNKFNKKDVFVSTFEKLMFSGGNDRMNLSCDGNTTNKGAAQLKNLTDTLFSCYSDISTACNTSNWPQPNMTKVSQCDLLVTQFKKGAEACQTETLNEADISIACSCWTGSNLNQTVQEVKQCKFSTEAGKIKTALKNCTETFSKCRKYEDAAITSISACDIGYAGLTKKARM